MKKITIIGYSFAVAMVCSAGAMAAEAVNNGTEARTLLVTDQGSRLEIAVEPGQTVQFCDEGCFVTLPSGDRHALTGAERLEMTNDSVLIK